MTLAISARGLEKSVPRGFWGKASPILCGVNLEVAVGSMHGLVGRNGAGKSTLMRAILGATRVKGPIELFGKRPDDPESRRGVGFAPDVPTHPGALTPLEVLSLHASLLGIGDAEVRRVLDILGLGGIGERPMRGFSKGQAQRVSLAAALLGSPRLLLLDEPMSGLDPEGRHLVRSLLRTAHAEGATIVFSSHVLSDVEDLCDSVTIIDRGQTIAAGAVRAMALADGGFTVTARQRPADGQADDKEVLVDRAVPAEALTRTLVELEASGAEIVSVAPHRRGLEQYLLQLLGPPATEQL